MGKEPVESQGWLETQAWSQDRAAVTGGDRIGGGRGGWRPVPGGPDRGTRFVRGCREARPEGNQEGRGVRPGGGDRPPGSEVKGGHGGYGPERGLWASGTQALPTPGERRVLPRVRTLGAAPQSHGELCVGLCLAMGDGG